MKAEINYQTSLHITYDDGRKAKWYQHEGDFEARKRNAAELAAVIRGTAALPGDVVGQLQDFLCMLASGDYPTMAEAQTRIQDIREILVRHGITPDTDLEAEECDAHILDFLFRDVEESLDKDCATI